MKRTLPPFSAVRAFEAAARHLKFKDAAEELNVTQSAISHQVKGLEEYLGVVLFRRRNNGITLTSAGEDYLLDVASVLDRLDAGTRRIRHPEATGQLRVCSTPAFAARWLLHRIGSFNSRYPDVELNITTTIETTDFQKDEVDVLIQYGQCGAAGLSVVPFLSSSRVPVCNPRLIEGRPPVGRPEDLAQYVLLRDIVGDGWTDWFKCAGIDDAGARGPRFEHCELSLCAAEEGQGIALAYAALISRELASGALVRLSQIETTPVVIYSLTCPQAWLNRPKISAFRNWLFEQSGPLEASSDHELSAAANVGYLAARAYSI